MADYTIAEDYVLPSEGLIYSKPVNPHVRLRSMTVRDEMKRLSQTDTPYKQLAEIIENCMLEKPAVSVYDMALGDYDYLLHKLRITTYGPKYKMSVMCPNCGNFYETEINLDELKVIPFDKEKFDQTSSFVLPVSGKNVSIRFQTPRMLDTMEIKAKEFKRKNKNVTVDPTPLIQLEGLIETVDGKVLSYNELQTFINNLSAADFNYIIQKSAKLNNLIGLNTEVDVVCDKCGGDISTYFRGGQEFFRPSISD